MFKKLLSIHRQIDKPIRQFTDAELPPRLKSCLTNSIYYTPKIQKIPFSDELAKYLRFLQRKNKIVSQDLRQMCENILTEYGAVHGLEKEAAYQSEPICYSIEKNSKISSNEICSFEGVVDYQVRLSSTNFFPVMFFQKELNPFAGIALAYSNMASKVYSRDNLKTSGYSIITTGEEWQMFKIYKDMQCEKTFIYEGRNKFKKLYEDYEMIEVILGMVDHCLETDRKNVEVLKNAYDLLDQQKNMIEASTKEEAAVNSGVSRLLTKYYEKKKNENSK